MKLSRLVLLSLAVVLASSPSPAQDATGRVIGTTYDQQGAVIPDVRIMVTNTATRESRKTTTDQDGYFQVLALPIGNYKVTAEHEGFRTAISDENKLLINQSLRIDSSMQVGSTSQKIEVQANALRPSRLWTRLWVNR